jgi:hypothetical protein
MVNILHKPPALRTPDPQSQLLQPVTPEPQTLQTKDMSTSRDNSFLSPIVEVFQANVALTLAFSPLLFELIMRIAEAAGWKLVIFRSKLVIDLII